ncbi:MAG: AraC family transcriptional regulator [Devosia nanyangense]|uniref:AraC family transcriptional regulator n=1 Tax=Devosia nanyangense TaxID=1228055 RepID=A0A933L1Y3_9HYPH|nr:AraC family transcriptional regulator [Devosia nanyangense]
MQLLSFSTGDFAERDRAEAARAAYAGFASIGIEPRGEEPFRSHMTALPLPGLGIGRIVNSACAVTRTAAHIAGGNDDLVLFIVTEGRVKASLKGREDAVYAAGEAYLAPNDLPGDFLLDSIGHIQIAVPRALIERRIAKPDRIVGRRLRLDASPELAFLAEYARLAMATHETWTPALAGLAASHAQDLVALMLGARRDDAEVARLGGLRAARLRAVLAEIETHFAEPGFTARAVGARLRLAERTVQDLLHETGVSFSERALELRLQKALAMLSSSDEPHQVSQIAYACGFNSVAYFNRCFRRRFGETPTQARPAGH